MKYGIIISIVIVLAFVGTLLYINAGDPPDPPTDATAPAKLARAQFPADMPALHEPSAPGADAGQAYQDVLTHFSSREPVLTRRDPSRWPREPVTKLRELMVEAMRAGDVPDGFLDRYLPVKLQADPRFGPALEWIQTILLHEADRLREADDDTAARDAAMAVWALGRRAFEHNTRLFNRRQGLRLMAASGQHMLQHADRYGIDTAALRRWANTINTIQNKWMSKSQIIYSVDPHAGDLINLAKNDKDRSFRVGATLRLGIAKFTADGPANREAVQQTIDQLKKSDDQLIREAAQAADNATRRDAGLTG